MRTPEIHVSEEVAARARLYANALSSRFLLTSTLRSASAVVIGWVFGIVGVTALVSTPTGQTSTGALASNGVLFLIGLFHNSAIDMMRTRALRLFGKEGTTRTR